MKKKSTPKGAKESSAVVEYDFSKGVQGKYAAKYWDSAAQGKVKRPRKKPA
jgi:hypothetical protein